MKSIFKSIFIVVIIVITLISCRKGEEDPFFSFRSRKARITGYWRLTSGTTNISYNDTTQVLTYNGASIDYVVSAKNEGTLYSGNISYSELWKINKNNTFEMYKNYPDYDISMSGDWVFYPKDKCKDLKNKEAILFSVKSKKYIYPNIMYNQTYTYTGDYCPYYMFTISQLKNDEIILGYNGSGIATSIWPGENQSENSTFIFTQDDK